MNDQTKETNRTLTGVVVSDKMDKSAIVRVQRRIKHPVYGKYVRRSTNFHIHDEENSCKEGDTVLIRQCRPVSKTKSWQLVDIVEKAQ
jgi:small subunit ribosomal protein S17